MDTYTHSAFHCRSTPHPPLQLAPHQENFHNWYLDFHDLVRDGCCGIEQEMRMFLALLATASPNSGVYQVCGVAGDLVILNIYSTVLVGEVALLLCCKFGFPC